MTIPSKAAFTLYHNPRCSKSRATLALLEAHGVEPVVVEYLKTPLSASELKTLLSKLKIKPIELARKGEDAYKEAFGDSSSTAGPTDAQLIAAMVKHPELIERPILVKGDKAVIGRPPENVLTLLK